jgi:sensor histidine kinase YesM
MEESAEVRVQVRLEDSQIVVRVMDNGKGMNERQRQQLLGAGEEQEAHIGHSTGLGMQNVRRRLELFFHTGELVDVESVPAQGTTVKLRMPVKEWQKAGGQAG